jgi:hypothetical protein
VRVEGELEDLSAFEPTLVEWHVVGEQFDVEWNTKVISVRGRNTGVRLGRRDGVRGADPDLASIGALNPLIRPVRALFVRLVPEVFVTQINVGII